MNYQQMGNQIRKIRKQRGMTQEKLAELAYVSVPYISHIEEGHKETKFGNTAKDRRSPRRNGQRIALWPSTSRHSSLLSRDPGTSG